MKTIIIPKDQTELFHSVLIEQFGEPIPLDDAIRGYEYTVFEERHLRKEESTFLTALTLKKTITYIRAEETENGVLSKRYTLRVYHVDDDRQKEDPKHYSTPNNIISLEIRIGWTTDGWSIPFQNEFPYILRCHNEHEFDAIMERELHRDRSAPKYVIWEHCDPRIIGDNYSEVYDEVYFIGFKDQAEKVYHDMRNFSRYAGSRCTSFTFPQLLKDEKLKIGDHRTIYGERRRPETYEEACEDAYDEYFENQED